MILLSNDVWFWSSFNFSFLFQVSNQEAVDLVRPFVVGVEKPELSSACKKLAELSLRRGSMDDISVMIVQLGHFLLWFFSIKIENK